MRSPDPLAVIRGREEGKGKERVANREGGEGWSREEREGGGNIASHPSSLRLPKTKS